MRICELRETPMLSRKQFSTDSIIMIYYYHVALFDSKRWAICLSHLFVITNVAAKSRSNWQ